MSIELTPELRAKVEETIRFLAVDAVEKAKSGHPGAPMGLAAAAFELWDGHLRFDPSDPEWALRDRFVLSGGHASMLIYSLLYLFGYELTLDDIRDFRQLGSKTPGHPERGDTPGVEVTTGPLGQGFAHAVGMALAGRLTASHFGSGGEGPGQHHVYGFLGDGDLMEGVSSEAASFAGHLGLGNLIFLFDDNQVTIDGPVSLSFSENVPMRFEAHGWHVQSVDGDDVAAVRSALEAARNEQGRPSLIVTRTLIGKGSEKVAGTSKAHGAPLGADEVRASKTLAGWPLEPDFHVPEEVLEYCRGRSEEKKRERKELDGQLDAWRAANSERASAWDAARERRLPADLADRLCEGMEGANKATRALSGAVLEKAIESIPYMVGGSADLAGSAAPPVIASRGIIGPGGDEADPFAGGNIHFGVREHAMGGITNGIALDGTFIPYSGTFLIFSDYLRPAIRLAALMRARSIFVFTHDSFYVGEDGPTHQPIEQLDSLRAIPGLTVFRPADGVETAMAYAWILESAEGPAMLSLTRQNLTALSRSGGFDRDQILKGAYVAQDGGGDKPLDVVLMASGSEVSLCVDAASLLAAEGVAVRVVSAPSLELFAAQSTEYRASVVPDDGTPVVAVEAGCAESYRRFIGTRGLVYGMNRFGASAPAAALAEEFGFTAPQLASRVREHLKG
jgi:transketolase